MAVNLTERQQRERDYHAHHAEQLRGTPAGYPLLENRTRKWWNHYHCGFRQIEDSHPAGKRALVPGCGHGYDAVVLAGIGADVWACDLSPEMLNLAGESAREQQVSIRFDCCPIESMPYPDNFFDLVWIRDILHHCEVPVALGELARVAKPGAFFLIDELYTYSRLQHIRECWIGRALYPVVDPIINPNKYITKDERKLDERELQQAQTLLDEARAEYFNVLVGRIVNSNSDFCERLDRRFMRMIGPAGKLIAGRFVLSGRLRKNR